MTGKGSQYQKLYTSRRLWQAWESIKGNKSRGGVDRQSVKDFEEVAEKELKGLADELRGGTYIPEPYLEIQIPKSETEKRTLGLATVRDKVVQHAVLSVLKPLIEKDFKPSSYAYRENKGAVKAIRRVRHMIHNEKRRWFIKEDIDDYFDSIPLDILESLLNDYVDDGNLVQLTMMFVRMGRVDFGNNWKSVNAGVPQGALISPLLSNLYLHRLDVWMEAETEAGYVRYGDDFVILVREEQTAVRLSKKVRAYVTQELRLKLNPGKVGALKTGLDYLGLTFYHDHYTLSEKKFRSIEQKVHRALKRAATRQPGKLYETLEGIRRYYGRLLEEDMLIRLDERVSGVIRKALVTNESLFYGKKGKLLKEEIAFCSEQFRSNRKAKLKQIQYAADQFPAQIRIDPQKAIRKKKRQYDRLKTQSFDLLVNSPGVYLGISRRGVTVKQYGKIVLTAPAANLRFVSILSKGVSLSSNLINFCAEREIPIVLFNRRGRPSAEIYTHSLSKTAIWHGQLAAYQNGKAVKLCQSIVSGKIRNQANLLKYYAKYYKEANSQFAESFEVAEKAFGLLHLHLKSLKKESLEVFRSSYMAMEAQGAKAYWKVVKVLVKEETGFEGRERQGAKDLFNSLLNYGYGILYSRIWEAVIRAGLNPYLSYLHTEGRGRPALVFDLIEEFRVRVVDGTVITMVNQNVELALDSGHRLNDETRKRLAQEVIDRLNTPETFRGTRMLLGDIIRKQAVALGKYFAGGTNTYRPYILKW